ncbi:NAPE-hydrolyzing phospholipase D [Drepanopeziza brunnea f. sp. 'multigermtubi' MB_m1]|uniref:NAPE-hydrolyzing phospholipase D n=1 Tax=Marssonina brunnea f. sp. multigermtubi (strain MB_m1) TaxID=1072389 RepID=K1XTV1_MARBU|nr:NAPE-hydrolyzing phospholipase D [Drepanopeziza brunnea f. sp. 'multigermtubi' MB_m1]EKD16024.1 NAPE-hydrolyzing phospholipase D [Drepanopeziza brunnea f. sp. 'multigermtubi' MB_m1]
MSGSMKAAAAAIYACTVSAPSTLGAVPEDAAEHKHHVKDGKGFTNPWDSWREMSGPQIGTSMAWRKLTGSLNYPDTTPPTVTVIEPTFLPSRTACAALRATWLGHACYYVEFPSGLRVLFDPVFEERCSPFSWLGPKRYTPTPCRITALPVVDLVVISHSHYDHLSHPTVKELHKNHPEAQFLVGLGLKKWFQECGIEKVVEMDWWQDVDVTLSPSKGEKRISTASPAAETETSPPADGEGSITAQISCLPCQHTSARTAFDKGHTLWASWAVSSGGKSVWFGGDTGYRAVPEVPKGVDDYGETYKDLPRCPAFKQIGDLRGPFDLGLIPIGAYDPRYVMSAMHANPFDSVNIFMDTNCKRAMGIHWGTWVLTTEDVLEPPVLLKKAMKQKGLPETGVFDVCDIGESREFQ